LSAVRGNDDAKGAGCGFKNGFGFCFSSSDSDSESSLLEGSSTSAAAGFPAK